MTYRVRLFLFRFVYKVPGLYTVDFYCSFCPFWHIPSIQWENLFDYDCFHTTQVVLISFFPLDTTIKQYGESPWTFLGFRQGIFLLLSTFLWQIPDWTMIQPIHSWKIQSLLTYFWLNWHRRVNLNFGIPHAKQWTSHINSRWSWSSKVWVQDELTVGWFINRNV